MSSSITSDDIRDIQSALHDYQGVLSSQNTDPHRPQEHNSNSNNEEINHNFMTMIEENIDEEEFKDDEE